MKRFIKIVKRSLLFVFISIQIVECGNNDILNIPCKVGFPDDFVLIGTITKKNIGSVDQFENGSSYFVQCKNKNPLFNVTSGMSFGYLYVRCENGKILNEWNVELDKNKKDLFCDNDNVLENFKSCKRPRFKNVVVLNGNNVEYERSNAKFAARCYGDKTSKNFMVQCVGDEWVFVFDEGVFGEEEMTKHCEMATSQNVLN